jgi:hypothetical protein
MLDDMKMSIRILNATTIDNPIYGVRAGLLVEILELTLLEDGDWLLFNDNERYKHVDQLGKMACSIAKSNKLKKCVRKFLCQ